MLGTGLAGGAADAPADARAGRIRPGRAARGKERREPGERRALEEHSPRDRTGEGALLRLGHEWLLSVTRSAVIDVWVWRPGSGDVRRRLDDEAVLRRPGEDDLLTGRPQLGLGRALDVLLEDGHAVAVRELDDVLGAHAEVGRVGDHAGASD